MKNLICDDLVKDLKKCESYLTERRTNDKDIVASVKVKFDGTRIRDCEE